MTEKVDTLVIGAGLIGSSVTMHLVALSSKGSSSVLCVDADLDGVYSSSELNAGGVRATFLQPCNIRSSRASIEYYSQIANQIGYRPCGYLWLHGEETWDSAQKFVQSQGTQEWPLELISPKNLASRWPFLNRLDGVEGAVLGVRDGLINPNLLKLHYRSEARKNGAKFEDRVWVSRVEYFGEKIRVHVLRFPALGDETKKQLFLGKIPAGAKEEIIECRKVVNCAGPWAGNLAKILGYESPCVPVRRQISIFDVADLDLSSYGMIVDTSGVYFHPEATHGLSGFADPQEPESFNFEYDGVSFFEEKIWPALYERSTYFERMKHVTGWAGLYEVSPDESAIIGQVKTKQSENIFEVHSFSGHGAMHSYAAGLALAELIVYGQYQTLNLSEFAAERFITGKLLRESWVI